MSEAAKQVIKMELNIIYSPQDSTPFIHYFHDTKKILKKQANIKWTHTFKEEEEIR